MLEVGNHAPRGREPQDPCRNPFFFDLRICARRGPARHRDVITGIPDDLGLVETISHPRNHDIYLTHIIQIGQSKPRNLNHGWDSNASKNKNKKYHIFLLLVH